MERASVDEAYIDLTKEVGTRMTNLPDRVMDAAELAHTFIIGHDMVKDDNDAESKIFACLYKLRILHLYVGFIMISVIRYI